MRKAFVLTLLSLSLFAFTPIPSTGDIDPTSTLMLKYGEFDPLQGEPAIPTVLKGALDTNLWLVQSKGIPTNEFRTSLREAGGEITWYMPHNAYVVRMTQAEAATTAGLAGVRWLGYYHPAYRLEARLRHELAQGELMPLRKYNIVVVNQKTDKPDLGAAIDKLGGSVTHQHPTSILFEVKLTSDQLLKAARLDQVLWIDLWTPTGEDMNNARIQGGANAIETAGGYTGKGVNGHLYEGCEATHPDFNNKPINVLSGGGAVSHGHCTAGIVYGNGKSNPLGRGMAPDAQPHYTTYSTVTAGYSRKQVVKELVTKHDVMFTTASWGDARTTQYTSVSADADDIIFTHDIPWTQSQSNAGNTQSRPQAWAKNIFSIGGVAHKDNADRSDDSWAAGGGSTGLAADGRIKPDLCAYYDKILCSDLTSGGYSSGSFTTGFGGTSGATPIVAGHNALALQMFTDHIFNNKPKVPNGTRFQNRPHFTTLKTLMIANARQYAFSSTSTDNRREHVGWGFPDLKTMYENRTGMFLVDETDVLTQGNKKTYQIVVKSGRPELKVAMSFADPAGNPAVTITRVNDLTLKVTAPDKTVYWGNQGLKQGNYSTSGGSADTRDTVECVFINNPQAGTWTVEVIATLIAKDSHVETTAVDADFALCVSYGTLTAMPSIQEFGKGCLGTGKLPSVGPTMNATGGTLMKYQRTFAYAYPATTKTAITVTGFEMWTASPTATTTSTALHLASGGQPVATPSATGTMKVGTTEGFYQTLFTTPVVIPANTTFYISANHTNAYISTLTSGTNATCYHFRYSNWRASTIATTPSYKVLIKTSSSQRAIPLLTTSGAAQVGTTLTSEISMAAPNTSAFLFWGHTDKTWGTLNLPFDLTPFGASGCSILVSLTTLMPLQIDKDGYGKIMLPIPISTELLGVKAYNQVVIGDPLANQIGLVFTKAFAISIGN